MRLAVCLLAALTLTACADEDGGAPTTDDLVERSADMATPTDAAAPPLDIDTTRADDAPPVNAPAPVTPPVAPEPERPPPPPVSPPTTPDPAPSPPAPPVAQPETGGTTGEASAAALWDTFRTAVTARDASAIERLIADPVRLNGQSVPHAEFAEMTPGGSVSGFITDFQGELATTDALTPAADGGYTALATARDGETEAALVFRLAPDTDGTWHIVAIDAAG